MRILFRPINILLLAAPLGFFSDQLELGKGSEFIFLALSIIPLAGLIAAFTDVIADKAGDRIGGLLEATFGNSAFIIIGIILLLGGKENHAVVQASIAGAIITNTLFVLGLAFFLGSMRGKRQIFNPDTGTNYSKLLTLAVVALILPAVAERFTSGEDNVGAQISIVVAVVLLVLYFAYLMFDIFHINDIAYKEANAGGKAKQTKKSKEKGVTALPEINAENAPIAEYRAEIAQNTVKREEHSAEQRTTAFGARSGRASENELSPIVAIIGLAISLVATVFLSENLVHVTELITKPEGATPFIIGPWDLGVLPVTETFVGLIIIPIIGTAAEHISAIRSALDGRTEITVAVTAGAAIQVALLSAPIFVIVSYFIDPANTFGLLFTPLELAVFGLAAFLFYLVTEDGEGTWLEGVQLLAFYLIFAGVAFFLK